MTKVYKSKLGLELIIPLALIVGTLLVFMVSHTPHWIGIVILLAVTVFISHTPDNSLYN
jgi:hypothetical protein